MYTHNPRAAWCPLQPSPPIWSRDGPNATSPERETRPYVGLIPTTPQNEAGWRTEPPVSEPSAAGTAPAATSAAEPPEDPPGTRTLSVGCSVRPYAECSVEDPIPNSSQFVFPAISAPAARSVATAVASKGERYALSTLDPQVVVNSSVQMLSFTATGMPYSTPDGWAA